MTKVRPDAMNVELLQLLADVAGAGIFYETLSPRPSELRQLLELESQGYIRYCPYPEEFWIALPAGRDLLSHSEARTS